ncbi:unnamed protein product [Adineta steineri]|uniref:Uncharacterized protein n=1 Tax=Adineta steineri TaxID=433720 RepID=A0A815XVL4_9BILA|nr:unnamed protein product [Adineta steineri]CAF1311820.1 unnamed protein product [Adineta steineri]CAF1562091.1 unnamed protein product [Adineta steineri]CAF3550688.1 unnamed protein product [Adineta steineri]
MITSKIINLTIKSSHLSSIRYLSLTAINNARERSYHVADKKGFHDREDVNYDTPKQPKQARFRDHFRYTALEEVKMEQSTQPSLVESMIDPTKPPHKFHVVTKIQSTYGETVYVKEALEKLGFISFGRRQWDVLTVILKNAPSVNKHLYICKHMVQIKPLTFINGVPSLNDIGSTKLFPHSGHLTIGNHFNLNQMNISIDDKDKWPVNMKHIVARLHADKNANRLHSEYFPTKYDWFFGQDIPGVKLIPPVNPDIKDTHLEDL